MTLLSSKGMYGLAAMFELAQRNSDKPVQIKEISKKAKIPQNYLEQLLNSLRKAELVKSIRGAQGGYLLADDPKNISIKDILVALDGEVCIAQTKTDNPILELFYNDTRKKIEKIFDVTLADFNKYVEQYTNSIHYEI